MCREFGFRAKHSTTHALIYITEKIRSALDDGKVACGIFIDLQKAFDTVNHKILLKKMDHYGFRGKVNEWLRSYLCERSQKVTINGFASESRVIHHGVPQGSVFLYINDLHNCMKHSTTLHFWAQNFCSVTEKMSILQKNAVRIINFADFKAHNEQLFKKLDILNFKGNIISQNCLFVYDYLKGNLPNSFVDTFRRIDETYPKITRSAVKGQLTIPTYRTTRYGLKYIYKRCIDSWNMITSEINKSKKKDPRQTFQRYILEIF